MTAVEPPRIEGASYRFMDAGGLRVHVAEAGHGDPVLLLHGWPQHHYMWRSVIERLAPRYRVVAPDLRGFGWTEAPDHGYDGETFARDQVALLDALGLDRVKVIGHDWGGWTAFLLALRYPSRVERAVICNVPHPWPRLSARLAVQMPLSWYAQLNAMPGLGPLAHRSAVTPKAVLNFSKPSTFTPAEIASYCDRLRDPLRAKGMSKLYRYYNRVFAEALRGRFRSDRLVVPTLLLFGTRDRTITYRLVESPFEDYADDMQVELVPDVGHFIVNERPGLVGDRAVEHFSAS